MPLSVRMYQDDNDYWRIRVFLREVFLLNNRQELSWQVARLDYWRYFGNTHLEHYALDEAICLWETADGRIGAVITPEGRGNVYLHVHPALRSQRWRKQWYRPRKCTWQNAAMTGGNT
jgi:mycothiol synthase